MEGLGAGFDGGCGGIFLGLDFLKEGEGERWLEGVGKGGGWKEFEGRGGKRSEAETDGEEE